MRVILSVLLSLAFFPPAFAAKDNAVPMKPEIAAVVGQEAVSSLDVENRLKFIITSSRLSNTPDLVSRLRPQVVRSLVDEKLQLQDATKNGIKVKDEEVAAAIADIEKDRGLAAGAIFDMMDKNRIPHDTFTGQIHAQMAWRKLVMRKLRPLVRISDEEVDIVRKMPAAGPPQELKIGVLTLPVDKPSRMKEVEATVQKLSKELRGGASFEEITRQLTGQSARRGGEDAFWVRPGQLDPVMSRALSAATAGTITEPIRTPGGFTIVKVYETRSPGGEQPRDSELDIKEILLKLKPSAPQEEADVLLTIAKEVAKNPGGCEEKGVAGIDGVKDVEIDVSRRKTRMSELPSGIASIVGGLKPNEISSPFASTEGIRLFMLCEQKDQPLEQADRERIKNQIYQQKIELEAQKYLRNLRRDTFIEIR